jgi:hypothetical protein
MRMVTYPIEPSGRSPIFSPSRTDSRALIVEVGLDNVKTAESSSASVDTGGDVERGRDGTYTLDQGHRQALRVDVSATNPLRVCCT